MDIFKLLSSYDKYKYKINNGYIYPLDLMVIDIILDKSISDTEVSNLILDLRDKIKNEY